MTDADKRTLHEEYPLAKENEVFSGSDSMVQRVTIRKKVYKAKEYSSAVEKPLRSQEVCIASS